MFRISINLILIAFVCSEPQLDIPGVQHSTESPRQNGLRVLVVPNSYANDNVNVQEQPKSEANTQYDQDDRSQRYGMRRKINLWC